MKSIGKIIVQIYGLPLWLWVTIIAGCIATALGLNILFVLQFRVSAAPGEQPALWAFLSGEIPRRAAWVITIPIALYGIRRFPFTPLGWLRSVLLHALLALGFGSLSAVMAVVWMFILTPIFWQPFWNSLYWSAELLRQLTYISGMVASFVLYWLLLGCFYAINYYRHSLVQELRASQLESRLAQAELHALKMQLHPHFLFNALHSLSSLLYEDIHRADVMITRLGDFLRMTLDAPQQQQLIPLEQELALLQCYADIEQMRFEDRLRVVWDIEPDTRHAEIPALLLQPLVENAIRYGVLPRITGGLVVVSARRQDTKLLIYVRDNGEGYKPEDLPTASSQFAPAKGGIGLANTRERLGKLYGSAATLTAEMRHGEGFVVTIVLPFTAVQSLPLQQKNLPDNAYQSITL